MKLLMQKQFTKNQLQKLRTCRFKLTNLHVLKRLDELGVIDLHRNTGKEIYDPSRGVHSKIRYVDRVEPFYVEDIGAFGPTFDGEHRLYVERSTRANKFADLELALAAGRGWADTNVTVNDYKMYLNWKGQKLHVLTVLGYIRDKHHLIVMVTDAALRIEGRTNDAFHYITTGLDFVAQLSHDQHERDELAMLVLHEIEDEQVLTRLDYVNSDKFYGGEFALKMALHRTRYENQFDID